MAAWRDRLEPCPLASPDTGRLCWSLEPLQHGHRRTCRGREGGFCSVLALCWGLHDPPFFHNLQLRGGSYCSLPPPVSPESHWAGCWDGTCAAPPAMAAASAWKPGWGQGLAWPCCWPCTAPHLGAVGAGHKLCVLMEVLGIYSGLGESLCQGLTCWGSVTTHHPLGSSLLGAHGALAVAPRCGTLGAGAAAAAAALGCPVPGQWVLLGLPLWGGLGFGLGL